MKTWAILKGSLACVAAALLGGCSGDSGSLRQEVRDLKEENKALKEQVEKLSSELRPLTARVDKLDVDQDRMDKKIADARKDVVALVPDLVQQELQGRGRGRFFPQPGVPRAARFEEKPYMGFDGQDIEPDVAKLLELKTKSGVLVTEVREGSPAAVAGLKKNDVVVAFDKAEIKSFQDMKKALEGKKPNDVISLTIQRGDEKTEMKVTLSTRRVPVDE